MEFFKRTLRLNVKTDESMQKYPLPNCIISSSKNQLDVCV
jgi:hypothetical protein